MKLGSVVNPPERPTPFSNGQYAKFYTQNAVTAARKAYRRKVRGAGRAGWRGYPEQKTEKQGANKGRAPFYTDRQLRNDHGQRQPKSGWPFPDDVKPRRA